MIFGLQLVVCQVYFLFEIDLWCLVEQVFGFVVGEGDREGFVQYVVQWWLRSYGWFLVVEVFEFVQNVCCDVVDGFGWVFGLVMFGFSGGKVGEVWWWFDYCCEVVDEFILSY